MKPMVMGAHLQEQNMSLEFWTRESREAQEVLKKATKEGAPKSIIDGAKQWFSTTCEQVVRAANPGRELK